MMLNRKLRLFLLDADSGQAARYVCLEAVAELQSSGKQADQSNESASPQEISLGLLQSDHIGYVSFNMAPALESKRKISRLYIRALRRPDERHYLADGSDEWQMQAISARVRDAAAIASKERSLPSVQNQDVTDWIISPRSFTTQAIEVIGRDGCETLLLSNAPTQRYGFVQIIREPAEKDEQLQPRPPSTCAQKTEAPAICFRRGVIVEYESIWRPMGHGLGEALYSLPLAPCESVKLAIIDWARTDAASRGEDLSVSEQLFHNQRRDRAIEEIVRGAVSEWQRGGSVMGAAGGTYSYGSGSIAASLGAAYSTSAGDRNAAADTVQRLADAIAQASTATRRLQSTVVAQASQRESEQLQTRTVTNHNHCHALTVLYYEIVRHFVVETAALRARDVLLLRHPEQTFDAARVRRHEGELKRALLDAEVGAGFDAIRRRLNQSGGGGMEYGAVSRLIVKTTTGDEDTGWDNPGEYVRYFLLLNDGSFREFRVLADHRITGENWLYRRGRTNTFIFPVDPEIRLNSIAQVGVGYHRPGERSINWLMAGLEVRAITRVTRGSVVAPEMIPILRRTEVNYRFTDGGEWWADAEIPTVAGGTGLGESLEDQRLEQALLEHLNENRHYYNRGLWLSEDPNRRASLLEHYHFEHSGRTGRLIDFVDNRAVDMIGDYIVLPMGTKDLVKSLIPAWPEPVRQIISVPTRGAFAEAKLSNCNACEEIDDTRFWDWQQSPCPHEAPGIAPLTAGTRARDLDAEPSALPPTNVGVEQPQPAPDPAGMTRILELLGRSDIFRDMSGRAELAGVMQAVVNGAVQLSQEQMRQRTEQERIRQEAATERARLDAGQRSADAPAGNAPGGTGGATPGGTTRAPGVSQSGPSGGSGQSAARTRDLSYRQAHNAIDRAVQNQGMTPTEGDAQHRRLTEGQVQDTIDDSIPGMSTDEGLDLPSRPQIDLSSNTPEMRAFFPSTGGQSGRTTLAATVANAPADAILGWEWNSIATGITVENPWSPRTDIAGSYPGLHTLTFTVRSGLRRLASASTQVCVPQFVQIVEDRTAFDAALAAFHLSERKDDVLIGVRPIVEQVLRTVNVRLIWSLPPFNAIMPERIAGSNVFNVVMFLNTVTNPLLPPDVTGETFSSPAETFVGEGGPRVFNELIHIYPGGFLRDMSPIGRFVRALVASDMSDPRILQLMITAFSRMMGITIAHEILHALLGRSHNDPPIANDILNTGAVITWVQRTGIDVTNAADFPAPGTYRDLGANALARVTPGTQMRINQFLPVPPAFR